MIPEIDLKLETKTIPSKNSYSIDDMIFLFPKRIKNAIFENTNQNNRTYKGLITKEMAKICKRWKFWNRDIRKAYKNYVGMLQVPWTIEYGEPIIIGGETICVNKEILSRYSKKINPNYYEKIKSKKCQ